MAAKIHITFLNQKTFKSFLHKKFPILENNNYF